MSKCFIVAGMHRSATSLLAKAIHDQENIWWPCVGGNADKHQPHGYWESFRIVNMNEALLSDAGGRWWNPPSEEAMLEAGKRNQRQIETIMRNVKDGHDLWGFKDPRICLTFPVIFDALKRMKEEVHLIAVFRDVDMCAASISKRTPRLLSQKDAKALAREYNRRLTKWMSLTYA